MSETVTIPVLANNNLFLDWLSVTNQLAALMGTDVVTANSAPGGSQTTGNGYITGTFGAAVMASGSIRGGNVTSSANLQLTSNLVSGNCIINTTAFGTGSATVQQVNTQTAGISSQVIDSWVLTDGLSAEYLLTVVDNNLTNYAISKINIVSDGSVVLMTEYGQMNTAGVLGVFATSINATAIALNFTPTSTNTQIKGQRTLIKP